MEQVQIKDVKKGEFIRRKPDAKTSFIRGEYVRDAGWNREGRYFCSPDHDMNRGIYLKGTTKVWVGFTY
tara:strand:- start:22 stop:228 length:207 start_codon:yes stop_codon:yes gene_type:complete